MAKVDTDDYKPHFTSTLFKKEFLDSFYIDYDSKVRNIDCEKAFSNLNNKERLYSYYFSRASWEGAKICYYQRSFESPGLLYIF